MKSILFLIFLISSFITCSQNIYSSFSSGYQFGVGKQNLEHHSVSDFMDSYSPWHWKQVDLSLGKGVMTNFTFGCDLNQHYGFALSGSYLFGTEFSSKSTNVNNLTYERKLSGDMIRINPSFKIYVGENRIKTYADIGLILGFGRINFNYSAYNKDTTFVEYNFIYDGGFSIGASARFGIEYNLSKKILIFGEFNFISQSYAPEKGHLTEYVVNNVNMIEYAKQNSGMTEIDFVDELQNDPTITPVENEPSVRAKHSYPFHSYGLNIGVKYILWTKE